MLTTLKLLNNSQGSETWPKIVVRDDSLYTLFNLPKINQVYLFFRAELSDLDFAAGAASLEVALFEEHEIPWDELAFPVVVSTLKHYFEDRQNQRYPVRMFDVHYSPERKISTTLISVSGN